MAARTNQRGVAMITTILVLLVLTALGIVAAALMTQEDRISQRQDVQRAAFYVAEAGLRLGETRLNALTFSNVDVSAMLAHTAVASNSLLTPPVPVHPLPWDTAHLGTYLTDTAGSEFAAREVPLASLIAAPGRRAFVSLYVRNNREDFVPANPSNNSDDAVRLVSVGWIEQSGRALAIKMLEEEFRWISSGGGFGLQKLADSGGTSSGLMD
jgi:type IV pilus assembly protein PilX